MFVASHERSTPRQGSWELVLQHFDELKAQPGRSGRVPYAAYSGAMQAWDQQHTEDRETKNGNGEIGVRVWFAWGFERFGLVSWLVEMVWWIEVVWGGCRLFCVAMWCAFLYTSSCASRFNVHSTGGKVKFRTKVKLESVASPASSWRSSKRSSRCMWRWCLLS